MKSEFDIKWERELEFWFSIEGEELQRCLVAQGYEVKLFYILTYLFGSYLTAAKLINDLKKEIEQNEN